MGHNAPSIWSAEIPTQKMSHCFKPCRAEAEVWPPPGLDTSSIIIRTPDLLAFNPLRRLEKLFRLWTIGSPGATVTKPTLSIPIRMGMDIPTTVLDRVLTATYRVPAYVVGV